MTEYILKPVDPEELDKAVRDIKYKTELKEKNRNNQKNSVVTSEELEEKIRLETYKETEIEWILQNILFAAGYKASAVTEDKNDTGIYFCTFIPMPKTRWGIYRQIEFSAGRLRSTVFI